MPELHDYNEINTENNLISDVSSSFSRDIGAVIEPSTTMSTIDILNSNVPITLDNDTSQWRDTGSSISQCSLNLFERLEVFYNFRKREKILSFIEHDCFLQTLLFEIYYKISTYFRYVSVYLEVIDDPEGFDSPHLAVSISTYQDPVEALNILDQFDDEWWLDKMSEAHNKICVNIEFK